MRKRKSNRLKSRYNVYVFFVLLALEILMSFTFLGYIHIPPVSITYAFIPILIAGILLGPLAATGIGAVFGFCSAYKASAYYVMAGDVIFSPVMSGAPVASLLLSVGSRTLFGLLVGLMFYWAKRRRHPAVFLGLVAVCSRRLHSVLVYTVMGLFFPEQGASFFTGLTKLPDLSDLLLVLMCVLISEAAWRFSCSATAKKIRSYIDLGNKTIQRKRRSNLFFIGFALVVLCIATGSAIYFAQRTAYMMSVHGLELDEMVQYDLLLLQIQFLVAILALSGFVWLLFMMIFQYLVYREYLGQMDGLTGIMGRNMFLTYFRRMLQENASSHQKGCFLFLDVDRFKEINDSLGHPTGDLVLQKVAECLQNIFSEYGQAGRMGGDEFAVVLEQAIPRELLTSLLEQFQAQVAQIRSIPVTCSIGGYYFSYSDDWENVYKETDKLLYEAKIGGRAHYVIGGMTDEIPAV